LPRSLRRLPASLRGVGLAGRRNSLRAFVLILSAQAKKPRTVPIGAGNRPGDGRQALVGCAVPNEAVRRDRSENLKPSWYGESIGRYEGDTLVVDTIGIDERSWVDGFGTPHTKQLHVVERFHLIENGAVLEANVRIEDPGAFTMPWNAIQRYRQYEAAVRQVPIENLAQLASGEEGPLIERTCAENPNSFFPGEVVLPIPQAAVPDF